MVNTKTWRDRIASGLMWVAALSAFGTFLSSIAGVLNASPEIQVAEAWRLFGFVVFAGLFSLLAWRPRHYVGLWELVIFHKLAMALTSAILIQTNAPDATGGTIIDGMLALLLIVAYVLARGYVGWRQQSRPPINQ